MLPIDFDPCANCLQAIFPVTYGCDDCEWMVFHDDKERPFQNIDIDGNVIETDFNHAFNEGFVDGDISPIPDYSNECHDLP